MEETKQSWEATFEELQTKPYSEVLDQEFESGRYYELGWMIKHFLDKGDTAKVEFLEKLEATIEAAEGRRYAIGDKFRRDDENMKAMIEIVDFDEEGIPFVEYSEVNYLIEVPEEQKDNAFKDGDILPFAYSLQNLPRVR